MRPLSLDITGLHSFRERRSIDFEPLLRDRLFGIFGPTGGGKSTILDAMTLALFGKIERTRGGEIASAINPREKECVVSLTFGIGKVDQERRYRVERLYRLQKSGMKSEARLIDLSTDPPVTLADKGSEVSGMIEEILGIKAHDFRLSVVLPQGAFAEFLQLRPKDRGEMLQRIFGLEEMGNRINAGLRELRVKLESERTGIEAKLESLKEYDDIAVAQRREELDVAIAEAERCRERVDRIESARNDAEELYELIVERDRLLRDEEERQHRRERLEAFRAQLERARKAASIETVVRRAGDAKGRWNEAVAEFEKAKEAHRKAEEVMGPLRERKERADSERGETGRLTTLEKQIGGLEAIVEIDERIGLLTRSLAERREKIATSETRLHENRIAVDDTRLAESLTGNALDALKEKIATLDEEERALAKRAAAVQQLERLASQREEKQLVLKKVGEEENDLVAQLGRLRDEIDERRRKEKECSTEHTNARNRYEEARLGNALGEAIALLHDGEPCPLCGSVDHPHPHNHIDSQDLKSLATNVQETEKTLAKAVDDLRVLEKDETSLETRRSETCRRREEIEKEFERTGEEIGNAVAETEYKGETDTATLSGWRAKIAERLARKEQERETAKKEIESLEAKLRDAREGVAAAREEIAKLEQAVVSDKMELERDTIAFEEIGTKRSERLREIGLEIPAGRSERELAERKDELNRLKKAIEEIERKYEQGQAGLNEASKEYDRCFTLREREENEKHRSERELRDRLQENGFGSMDEWERTFIAPEELERKRDEAEKIAESLKEVERRLRELADKIGEKSITEEELAAHRAAFTTALREKEAALTGLGKAEQAAGECEMKNVEWKKIVAEEERSGREYAAVKKLAGYLQGNAFINFLADEGLQHICRTASNQLLELTGGRLEVGSRSDEGFFIRDNGNGGAERPPGSLSGGETFLVSLALSLALSDSLQVGRAPMEFFFLDEGFGTLDDDLLEIVLDSLERLRSSSHRAIGVISHVPQLRERIPRRLIVTPSSESSGSDVRMEIA